MQIVGAFWYLLAMERNDACWRKACDEQVKCNMSFLYCGIPQTEAYNAWRGISGSILNSSCSSDGGFDYGIYTNALSSSIVSTKNFLSKYCYCLWWGLQNLRYLNKLINYHSCHISCQELICFVAVHLDRDLKQAPTLERLYFP